MVDSGAVFAPSYYRATSGNVPYSLSPPLPLHRNLIKGESHKGTPSVSYDLFVLSAWVKSALTNDGLSPVMSILKRMVFCP
jgi:hypothetical protein